jgi:hypothetical protein
MRAAGGGVPAALAGGARTAKKSLVHPVRYWPDGRYWPGISAVSAPPGLSTAGPARTSPDAAGPGSALPLCRTYRTGPGKAATVTRAPSAVRVRVMLTPGLGIGGRGRGAPDGTRRAGRRRTMRTRRRLRPVTPWTAGAPRRTHRRMPLRRRPRPVRRPPGTCAGSCCRPCAACLRLSPRFAP